MAVVAVIVGAGGGTRFSSRCPKQFFCINGFIPFHAVVDIFIKLETISKVVCVVPPGYQNYSHFEKDKIVVVTGGQTRQESVRFGLEEAAVYHPDFVVIHDAARPFLTEGLVKRVIIELLQGAIAVVPVLELSESLRYIAGRNISVSRDEYASVQTPQGFNFEILYNLHQKYKDEIFFDDASMFDRESHTVTLIEGERSNLKITYENDWRPHWEPKIGIGFDVHPFSSDKTKRLKLFGVDIPGYPGLEGVSDSDVCAHSLTDALLGAVGLGDIGDHFPPSDPKNKDMDSFLYLKFCKEKLQELRKIISNIDIVVICEEPKITDYKNDMKFKLSVLFDISPYVINIKGKTTEHLGFCGRKEGIAVISTVCLL